MYNMCNRADYHASYNGDYPVCVLLTAEHAKNIFYDLLHEYEDSTVEENWNSWTEDDFYQDFVSFIRAHIEDFLTYRGADCIYIFLDDEKKHEKLESADDFIEFLACRIFKEQDVKTFVTKFTESWIKGNRVTKP